MIYLSRDSKMYDSVYVNLRFTDEQIERKGM